MKLLAYQALLSNPQNVARMHALIRDIELDQPAPAGNLYAHTAAQLLAMHLMRQVAFSTVCVSALLPCKTPLVILADGTLEWWLRAHDYDQRALSRCQSLPVKPYRHDKSHTLALLPGPA